MHPHSSTLYHLSHEYAFIISLPRQKKLQDEKACVFLLSLVYNVLQKLNSISFCLEEFPANYKGGGIPMVR